MRQHRFEAKYKNIPYIHLPIDIEATDDATEDIYLHTDIEATDDLQKIVWRCQQRNESRKKKQQ